MHKLIFSALAGASVLGIATTATAQPAQPPPTTASGEAATTLAEIVVTARRRRESLQDAPLMVNVVTADSLQKLNIKQFQDIQTVVPGLSLAQNGSGYQAAASLRGVTFDVSTSAQPTVALYLNEAPVQALFLFQSLYDVGQVEVLRGPQGTARGVSAPSGAITVSSLKPDLAQYGGYADVTLTDLGRRAAQGAVNLPLIKDVLGLRVAGVIDQSDQDGVRSLNNPLRPRQATSSERVSLAFKPSDRFSANVTYQHLDKQLTDFDQVSGPGQGTSVNPAISPDQRLSVEDGPNEITQHFDVVTAQADGQLFGQHLSYVGSYLRLKIKTASSQDQGNLLPGTELYAHIGVDQEQTTHEIRMSSDAPLRGLFDYAVGAYYSWQNNGGRIINTGPLLPGAFGDPSGPLDFTHYNPRYQVPVQISIPSILQETSIFANATFHLGHGTELSTGVRQIFSIASSHAQITTGQGFAAVAPGVVGAASCAAAGLGSTYPGTCDLVIPGGMNVGDQTTRSSETPHIYNLSLSQRVTPGLLVYANTGTSYRPPVASIGIQGALAVSADPALSTLTFHPSERTRGYEVGFKATFLHGRGRLDAAAFRQRFENLTIFVPGVTYLNAGQPANFDFTASVDALVQGFDIDSALQITPNWNLAFQMSYADGRIQNSKVPCNITDAAGNPVFNTGGLISLCPGGSSSRLPLWNASLQTEYVQPVSDKVDGFVRGLVTYYPQNRNRVEPDFTVGQYSLANVYAGLRSHDGAWEVSMFARNAFKTDRTLDVQSVELSDNTQLGTAVPGLIRPSGYALTLATPRREVGLNLHYAWGSR